MGKRHIARKPRRKMSVESTPAMMGRRMKKLEKFIVTLLELPSGCEWVGLAARDLWLALGDGRRMGGDGVLRSDRHSGPNSSEAVPDDPLVAFETGTDDARAGHHRPESD